MDEFHRLRSLHSYDILDTVPEADFDQLTWLAAHICKTPIAVLTLVDETRQWFKSIYGLDVRETPREIAFCNHAIQYVTPFVVEDAAKDSRFASNPLVINDPRIRFYLGIPLISPEGFAIGTLAVIDQVPRTLAEETVKALCLLAHQAMHNLNARRERLASEQAYCGINAGWKIFTFQSLLLQSVWLCPSGNVAHYLGGYCIA
jgi:GAF domain-containing protein